MTIAALEDRAVLRVAGADARPFLQGLLTHDMALLAADTPLYAGLLSPQGKALFDMLLFLDPVDDSVLVDVAAARAEALAKRLSLYRMRKAVTITPTDRAVFASWGEPSPYPADPRFAPLGSRWIAAAAPAVGDAAAYHAHRIATGVPDSADIGEDALLWLETGADLLNGVSFTKGCYVGQENTARMHHRDKVRRRLVPISFTGDGGDNTIRDGQGRSAGTLRSRHFAHLRLETAAEPLFVGTAPVTIHRPAWLAPALAAA
jgi:folate-binding protein YgfZ